MGAQSPNSVDVTHDELIAMGIWSGRVLEMRKRMAEYFVDGKRFGSVNLETKSGSPNDPHLAQRISEITTAAMVLALLEYERVEITTMSPDGKDLERPDLDVLLPNGDLIGIEVADVSETDQRKHQAGQNRIEVQIADLLDSDPTFKKAMGFTYLTINLNGIGVAQHVQIGSNKEARQITDELVAFVRSGAHLAPSDEGAQFHAEVWEHEPCFSVSEGASTIGPAHRLGEVLRVLDKHRASAEEGYRNIPTWIALLLTDTLEYFYNTIDAVERTRPSISPFVRAYVIDATWRMLLLE
jgi:hypothetical protein